MKQQPDKIFRDKLEQYSRPAPEMAWNRIESGLQKKRFVYWKYAAAASVVLLLGINYILFRNNPITPEKTEIAKHEISSKSDQENQNSEVQAAIKNKEEVRNSSEEKVPAEQDEKNLTAQTLTKTSGYTHKKNGEKFGTAIVDNDKEEGKEENTAVPDMEVINEAAPLNEPVADNSPIVPENEVVAEKESLAATESKENIVLVLTSSDTQEYLIKNENSDATSASKKSSTLKRMLKKASELKTNQDPFGDLRQMKNEILALNFKSDKQRGQKK